VRLLAVGEEARDPWRRALAMDSHAVISQTPAWMDCICGAGGYEDATRAYEAPDGRTLILPLARARPLGIHVGLESSLPWGWGTGGIVSADGQLSARDVGAVAGDLSRRFALRIAVRPGPAREDAWDTGVPRTVPRTRHMVQTVDLTGGFDDVWKRFSGSVRRACAKAQRSDLVVESDDTGRLVGVFDALYRTSVARWAGGRWGRVRVAQLRARLREPRRKFERVAESLGPSCSIWVAWRGGKAAAALLLLSHGDHVTYWRGAMDTVVEGGTRANDLLHRMAIEDACRSGRRFYHMGESAPASPLARFKRGFAAEEHYYTAYRFERLPLTAAERHARRQAERIASRARRTVQ
jgi:hypothetical protein